MLPFCMLSVLYGSVKKVCVAAWSYVFRCVASAAHFLYVDGGYMGKDIQKYFDITGIELMPGKPTVCLGNGEQGFECCCDECDYYLLCFSEFDPTSKEEDIVMNQSDT